MDGPDATGAPRASVVITEPPRRRYTVRWVGLGLAAAAALGVGAFFVVRGDGTTAFSLDAAIARDNSAIPAVDIGLTTTQAGQTLDGTAVYDVATRLMRLTMSGAAFGTDQDVELILDVANATMYLSSKPFVDLGAEVDTDWISVDFDQMTGGLLGECAFGPSGTNPYTAIAQLDAAESVTRLEMGTVEGEQVRHYEVVVDPHTLATPDQCLRQVAEQNGQDLPDEMIYDVWVTEHNEVRSYRVEFETGGSRIVYTYVLHPLDRPAGIVVPADDAVTDLDDLL